LHGADGGVQKIKSVIRAIMRYEKDSIDIDVINEDTSPTEVLKFIANQVSSLQNMDEKPEHVAKIIKRLKRLVSQSSLNVSSNDAMVPPFMLLLTMLIFQLTLDSSSNFLHTHHRRRTMQVALAARESLKMVMKS
jgi:hypothetical protein